MTIVLWNLVLNVTTVVLIFGLGIWLKYVVKQQIGLKDVTIESLTSAIKANESEISKLKAEAAPAIVANYNLMREHANQMSTDVQVLRADLDRVTRGSNQIEKLKPIGKRLSKVEGLSIAVDVLLDAWEKPLSSLPDKRPPPLIVISELWEATKRLQAELEKGVAEAQSLLKALD